MKLKLFRHYKGGYYKVLFEGVHTELGTEHVVYVSMSNDKIWIRPKDMFYELVTLDDGSTARRFEFIGEI